MKRFEPEKRQLRFRDLRRADGTEAGEPGIPSPDGRLVWGDGLDVMRVAPPASYDAIYLDPPFWTQRMHHGERGAFSDCWETLDDYLQWLAPWITEARRLLKPDGWFWLHADYHADAYLRVLADQIFDRRNFRNEIIWHYTGRRTPARRRFNQKHDVLLVYARSPASRLNPLFEPWSRAEYLRMKRQRLYRDESGREWIWGHAGRGRSKAYRIYLDEQVARGRAIDSVWDLPIINTSARERSGYPTQKPIALLKRIILASSPPGGVVGDFMAGSGTTGVAAFQCGRRFVLVDRVEEAVRIAEERLAGLGARVVVDRPAPDE